MTILHESDIVTPAGRLNRAPASQSGLQRPTWKDRSKPRASAASLRYSDIWSACADIGDDRYFLCNV
jgi:hypothetical protein